MSFNPALLGTLVAIQNSKLTKSERSNALVTGFALGGANAVTGFLVGKGAVAQSSLTAERTAASAMVAENQKLKAENAAFKESHELAAEVAGMLRQHPSLATELKKVGGEAASRFIELHAPPCGPTAPGGESASKSSVAIQARSSQ